MTYPPLPATAAWRHLEARTGFEVTTFKERFEQDGAVKEALTLSGTTTAVEDGEAWVVSYQIVLDARWRTREARVDARSANGERSTHLVSDGEGRWQIDGAPAEHLTGCLDIDLESSAMTNTLPVHRLAMAAGERVSSPAAYIRALEMRVERLEQSYERMADDVKGQRFAYAAPVFGFACELAYDLDLLVRNYPGIARRHPVDEVTG